MANRDVYTFKKNTTETVRVQIGEYNGNPVVDFRVWVTDGELRPTRKGLTVGPKVLDELAAGIEAARDALAGDELATDPDMQALKVEARQVNGVRLRDHLEAG